MIDDTSDHSRRSEILHASFFACKAIWFYHTFSYFLVASYYFWRMTVAVNTRFLLPNTLEGSGWYTFEVIKRMVEAHPEDEFIFFFDRAYDERFIFADNIKPVVVYPQARHPILWYLWFEWGLPSAIRKAKPDVFLSTDSYCSLSANVKTLMVTHDIAHIHFPEQIPNLVRRYYDYFVPKFLKRADLIATISQFCKADIEKHYQIPSEKIFVAHNGCRDNFSAITEEEKQNIKNKYSDGQDYFFYVGAVHPRKNLVRLIQAFNLFKKQTDTTVKLLIGGRMAWQTGDIHTAYQSADCREDITFLGYLPEEDLPKVLSASLALTYVSLFEGFGLPILEAMYAETAVICSNTSSMPEVAAEAAILVDPYQPQEVADAMQKIWRQPALRQILIEKGKEQRQQFNWGFTAQRLYEGLKKLANA